MAKRRLSLATATLAVLLVVCMFATARAQQPTSQSYWTFNFAPYLWLPSVNTTLNYNLPPALGGRLPTDITSGPGDYLPNLKFATMFAADARYDRFSILTDFMYTNVTASKSTVRSLDFFGLPSQPISRSLQIGATTTLKAAIWTLAGGYTIAEGDWGNFDVIAGFRFLNLNANTNYDLALTVTGPRRNGATFGGVGNISGSGDLWNGIGGVRGRIRLADTGLFVPYYFDIGAGGSNLTWQIASGLGYQTGWAGVSVLYRYLSFEQDSNATIKHLALGGPMVMVNFSF
jgi:hypothetical protein